MSPHCEDIQALTMCNTPACFSEKEGKFNPRAVDFADGALCDTSGQCRFLLCLLP
jgi:hypothetical protein